MTVKTMDEYRQMVQQQLDPLYQSKTQNLQAGLNTQLANYDTQATNTNKNYDTQLGSLKINNADDMNTYNNNVLGRGLARSSIAVTGLEGVKGRGQMRVDALEGNRQTDLGNIESQKSSLRNSLQTQLQALDNEKLAQIISGAQNLYNTDAQKDYEAQQAELAYQREQQKLKQQQDFEAQQNALNRAASSKSSGTLSYAQQRQQQQDQQAQQKQNYVNSAWTRFAQEYNDGTALNWLKQNPDMINYIGADEYNKMLTKVTGGENTAAQNLNKYQASYRASGQGRQLLDM